MSSPWLRARKTAQIEVRGVTETEVVTNEQGPQTADPGDFVARDPGNHADQWVIKAPYFRTNYELVEADHG